MTSERSYLGFMMASQAGESMESHAWYDLRDTLARVEDFKVKMAVRQAEKDAATRQFVS